MRIIPAIDIIDGKCVRLTQGDYAQKKVYNENPVDVAREFEDAGLKYLHLVDLDGAKAGKVSNWKVVESICKNTNLTVDFGGGIKTEEQITQLFDSGVAQVNLVSSAKFYRITGIADVDEVHALYGATIFDVKAGDDSFG